MGEISFSQNAPLFKKQFHHNSSIGKCKHDILFSLMQNPIPYHLVRASRRTVGLQVTREGDVVVRAPSWTRLATIDRFVAEKAGWIQLQKTRISQRRSPRRQFADGDLFWVDGLCFPLRLCESGRGLGFDEVEFRLPIALRDRGHLHFLQWYKRRTQAVLEPLVAKWSACTGFEPVRVTYNSSKSRWGSATSKRALNFSFRLAMVPLEIAEYIVVHEFAHFAHMNHSLHFWKQVGLWLPDYAQKDRWIRQYGWQFGWEF